MLPEALKVLDHLRHFPHYSSPFRLVVVLKMSLRALTARASSPISPAMLSQKAALQEEYVKQLWFLLTAVIGLLTIVHWSTRLYERFRTPRSISHGNGSGMAVEKQAPETLTPGRTGKISLRRIPLAITSAFRVLAFRTTVPIGPSSVMSLTEVSFIISYTVTLFVWLWINSAYTVISCSRIL